MAIRGRKPKPTALKKSQGNPGKRKLNKKEPVPESGDMSPPDWMMPEAKSEWDRVTPELMRTCGLAKIDRAMLAAYCQIWARFVEGEKKDKPVKAAHIAQLRALASSLGLEPSSRSRLGQTPDEPQNDFDKLDDLSASGLGGTVYAGRA